MTSGNCAPISIIVVDDHPVVRDGIRGMLEREPGMAVIGEAGDGAEALEQIGRLRPDVVLMDLRMPVVDGVTAIRRMRALDAELPRILVLTTYDTDTDIRAAVDAGADGYLLKATPRADLIAAVRRAAAGHRVLDPGAAASLMSRNRFDALTARECEVLRAVAGGGTNRQVAADLMISEATVKTHLLRLYPKLGVKDRAAAVRVAFERGLIR
ncbi:response regulator [Jongsikchunia kroppenstedtii]|uniref:response regulator n=1 Tax=Jongsikchunia kroppenstedtii TaxID=1121721 RepID=UPI00036E52BF|nr:response regulator transcription factor [Jongsikchunia kroppenstedtii]